MHHSPLFIIYIES